MLTVVVFIILGVTGALLLFHYSPAFGDCTDATSSACNQAFQSVADINNKVDWGLIIRNIHYEASNAMVLLAVMHMFYQYFAGRYKLRYEMLWITGVILGVITIVEAYTGYDLILNIRGQLAINIGRTLTLDSPVIGADLANIIFGFGFSDIVLRFYAFHVFIIPIIMLAIMSVHLPKNLVLDIPVSSAITGIILVMGGLFPVEVGVKYIPNLPTQITFPEWYFTSLYAFIRVQHLDPFIAGAIIPAIFVLVFLIVPFFDRGKKIAMLDRPFWVALGVAALGQIAIVTVWGFRRSKLDALRAAKKPIPYRKVPPYILSKGEVYSLLGGLLLLQAFLDFSIFRAFLSSLQNFAILEIGMVFIAFAATVHIYRVSAQVK